MPRQSHGCSVLSLRPWKRAVLKWLCRAGVVSPGGACTCVDSGFKRGNSKRVGEMAQQGRALALAESLSVTPSPLIWWFRTTWNSSSWGSGVPFWPLQSLTCRYPHTYTELNMNLKNTLTLANNVEGGSRKMMFDGVCFCHGQ